MGDRMIIDMHTHIGTVENKYDMPIENLIYGMEKYKIDYALFSDITAGEPYTKEKDGYDFQYSINKSAVDLAREHRGKFGVLLWCRAAAEGFNPQFENLYCQNRDIVKGLKIHPNIASLRCDDRRYFPYYEMAQKYSLPILLHTADTEFSKVQFVETIAKKYPTVKFILGHMSLGGNKDEAFRIIKENKNVYGDTAWVTLDEVMAARDFGIEDKIMFGTDSPIAGKETHGDKRYYLPFYKNAEKMQNVMFRTARKVFSL